MVISHHYTEYLQRIHQYFNSFVPLSNEEFNNLMKFFEIREFDKKQQVVGIGEVDRFFNIILKGLVRKYTVVGKKDVTLQLSIEGQMIHSEISFNTQTPSDTIVETIEPTTFLSMSYDNLQASYASNPKLEKMGRLIITYMFIKKDYRDFSQLKKQRVNAFLITCTHIRTCCRECLKNT